jgi:putative ABC transport system permease protein
LILAAGALAFVVLYNLTNINITERLREIATIKVLGFRDKEVSAYVYRENIILTLIGTLGGLALGFVLHRFVMGTMEIDSMMFGKNVQVVSYLLSALLTMMFAAIVNIFMYRQLRKINMVESLKAAE